jgi:nucleoside-specific outer membrane channel protein Tsx
MLTATASRAIARTFSAIPCTAAMLLGAISAPAQAFDWSDTSIGYRYGTQFREPSNTQDVSKNIISLTHSDGYKYGSNFFTVDTLLSNSKDPASGASTGASPGGAQEIYLVYRHTLSFSKVSGADMKFGPIRDLGAVAGFDLSSKNDDFGARVRRPLGGLSASLDVPGYWNVGVLYQNERNHNGIVPLIGNPAGMTSDVHFKNTWRLETSWGIPFNVGIPAKFQGFLNYIAPKGRDGFGNNTKPELLTEVAVMFDIGSLGGKKDTFFAGVGYQYWRNKFGNDASKDVTGGSTAKVPQLLAEAHF